MKILQNGKSKTVYPDGDDTVRIEFKDDITAGNGEKHDILKGKGILLNAINKIFFKELFLHSIPNHYLEKISENSFRAKKVKIVPLEIVVRNYTAGSFCKRYGIKKGLKIRPLVEFFLKDDSLSDPLICKSTITELGIAEAKTIDESKELALKVNGVISEFVRNYKLILADFKIEVGFNSGKLLVADEITTDTCRLWDIDTKESLDKDVYRKSIGDPLVAYKEVLRRLSH